MPSVITNKIVKKTREFPRLDDRRKKLLELDILENPPSSKYLMEMDSIDHFGAGGFEVYSSISSFCKENSIERVVDIGCAHGHQSEIFLQEEIDYVGIDQGSQTFWNAENFTFISNSYPCELPLKKGDLGVSVLCLTWNCYLFEGETTLRKQCEALERDFDHCLLYMQADRIDFVCNYFKKVIKLQCQYGNLIYFSK
jgi:hypothetical protein